MFGGCILEFIGVKVDKENTVRQWLREKISRGYTSDAASCSSYDDILAPCIDHVELHVDSVFLGESNVVDNDRMKSRRMSEKQLSAGLTCLALAYGKTALWEGLMRRVEMQQRCHVYVRVHL